MVELVGNFKTIIFYGYSKQEGKIINGQLYIPAFKQIDVSCLYIVDILRVLFLHENLGIVAVAAYQA